MKKRPCPPKRSSSNIALSPLKSHITHSIDDNSHYLQQAQVLESIYLDNPYSDQSLRYMNEVLRIYYHLELWDKFLTLLSNISVVYAHCGRMDRAEQLAESAVTMVIVLSNNHETNSNNSISDDWMVFICLNLVKIYIRNGRFPKALNLLEFLRHRSQLQDITSGIEIHMLLGLVCSRTGCYRESFDALQKSLSYSSLIDDIDQCLIYAQIAEAHFRFGRLKSALETYRKALKLYSSSCPERILERMNRRLSCINSELASLENFRQKLLEGDMFSVKRLLGWPRIFFNENFENLQDFEDNNELLVSKLAQLISWKWRDYVEMKELGKIYSQLALKCIIQGNFGLSWSFLDSQLDIAKMQSDLWTQSICYGRLGWLVLWNTLDIVNRDKALVEYHQVAKVSNDNLDFFDKNDVFSNLVRAAELFQLQYSLAQSVDDVLNVGKSLLGLFCLCEIAGICAKNTLYIQIHQAKFQSTCSDLLFLEKAFSRVNSYSWLSCRKKLIEMFRVFFQMINA